jgi:hypothetical protein
MWIARISVAASFGALAATSVAGLIYNELGDSDLSNLASSPTVLAVDFGSNFLSASASSQDRDYFSLRLPPGSILAAIMLRRSDGVEATFLGMQQGQVFSEPPHAADLARTLGYAEFFASDVSTDLLTKLAAAPDAIGFSRPLVGADFTFWVEQKNTSPATYDLEFVIASIPSPGAWVLTAAGLGVGLWSGRRNRST